MVRTPGGQKTERSVLHCGIMLRSMPGDMKVDSLADMESGRRFGVETNEYPEAPGDAWERVVGIPWLDIFGNDFSH